MASNPLLMRWMDLYATGVEEIDREHEGLTVVLNSLYDAHRAGRPRAVILFRFDELLQAVREHFTHEQMLMEERDYPDLVLHIAEHEFLLEQVTQYREQFAAGTVGMTDSMLDFLKDWLRDHILISDRRLGAFLRGERC
jgi:hemerythrin-like metal-binding protein